MPKTKAKRDTLVQALMRPEEKVRVEERAEAEGLSVSTFTRRLLLEELKRCRPGAKES